MTTPGSQKFQGARRRKERRAHTNARWLRIEGMSGRQWKRHRKGLNRAANSRVGG